MLTRRQKLRRVRWLLAGVVTCVVLTVLDLAWGYGWMAALFAVICLGYIWLIRGSIRLAERNAKIDSWWRIYYSADGDRE